MEDQMVFSYPPFPPDASLACARKQSDKNTRTTLLVVINDGFVDWQRHGVASVSFASRLSCSALKRDGSFFCR
jgi:hypothetical protein